MTLTVGQTLWLVPASRWGKPHAVTVTKVGRKWAELGDRETRVNAETLYQDGGQYMSPGRCYVSQDAYEAERNADAAWNALKQAIQYIGRPPSVAAHHIAHAAQLLGVAKANQS